MKKLIAILVLTTGISFASSDYVERYEIDSKEAYEDIPLVVYARKRSDGLVDFSLMYRQITPFNSSTILHVNVENADGGKVFRGIIESATIPKKLIRIDELHGDIHHFSFLLHETFLKSSSISISTDWSRRKFVVFKKSEDKQIVLKANLLDLYEWSEGFGVPTYNSEDERLKKLSRWKGISLDKWQGDRVRSNKCYRGRCQ